MTDKTGQATPHEHLISELLDSRIPKSEREWAAGREIEALRAELAVLKSDYANRGTEIEWFRRELAAANAGVERLKGLSAKWRNTHDAITCAKAAADLDAILKENNDE